MPAAITPTPVRLPALVTYPNDGEPVDRSSTLESGTPIVNGIEWASRVIDILLAGGLINPTGSLDIGSLTGFQLILNSLILNAPDDGGGALLALGRLTTNDIIVYRKNIFSGQVAAGTYGHQPLGQTVYWDGILSMSAGVSWQVLAAPDGSWIRMVNDNPQSVSIKNPAGAVIDTLGGAAGSKIGDTYIFKAGALTRGLEPLYH